MFGGVSLKSIGGDKCKLNVVFVGDSFGLPLKFTPFNQKKGVIHVSTDLNIMFSAETNSTQSPVWKLDDFDASTGQWFVTNGGVLGNPGSKTVKSWFKIENYKGNYKLVYCPSVCKKCRVQCRDIGIYEDKNGKRLALSDVPYNFQFLLA
ncbi:Proteinase inhibitor I3, Kunitz legume [Sesbania bispinosa]|nr:Proteinase inhibitor I3, Kunitz legume [Sesbania bispinosa]